MKILLKSLLVIMLGLFISTVVTAQEEAEKKKTNFKFGGFAKADYLATQYNRGDDKTAGRDFHIPGAIPVGAEVDVHRYNDFHIKESRFNFEVSTLVNDKKLRSFIELDFMLSGQGNERVSNSFSPRLRHFFLEYDKILVGQTWTTFMIVILPDELDFIGSPEGIVFVRQPQLRLTLGTWQFSLENQFTTITPNGGGARIVSETAFLPDAVVRKNFKLNWANFSIAAIGRQLHYIDTANGGAVKHFALGAGVSAGGKIKVGKKDDIRFVGTAGQGLGRYVGLNFVNSSVIDESLELKPTFTVNGYLAYLHHWSPKFRTSTSLSYMQAKDQTIAGGEVNDVAFSASTNLIYSPVDNLLFGIEPIYAYRELENGSMGDFVRIQVSAKYAFSFKTSTSN